MQSDKPPGDNCRGNAICHIHLNGWFVESAYESANESLVSEPTTAMPRFRNLFKCFHLVSHLSIIRMRGLACTCVRTAHHEAATAGLCENAPSQNSSCLRFAKSLFSEGPRLSLLGRPEMVHLQCECQLSNFNSTQPPKLTERTFRDKPTQQPLQRTLAL